MYLDKEGRRLLSLDDLRPLVNNDCIIDVSTGGLLLGNSHDDGGIMVIRQFNEDHYELFAEFEGWEYILNAQATQHFLRELHIINNELKGKERSFLEYMIPKHISILDARPIWPGNLTTGKLLIVGSGDQFIINRHSTKKYIADLEELNLRIPATVR